MVDVDRLLRESLHHRAEDAPTGERLLAAVHARSGRIQRRRRMWARTSTALAVGLLAVAVPAAAHLVSSTPPATNPGSVQTDAPASSGIERTSPARGSSTTTPTAAPLGLAPPTYPAPVYPFRPDASLGLPQGGLKTPVITLDHGELQALFSAKDGNAGADVTIVVTAKPPAFTSPAAGPVREVDSQVRGHAGRLRTVVVSPAKQLTLYWQESATQWVQVRTDDTLTDAEVVQFANALLPAALPADVGLQLDLAPTGMVLDTATLSGLALRPGGAPPGAPDPITCTLVDARPVTSPTTAVGRYRGVLTRAATGVSLAVNLTDRGMTLLVGVPARYAISDADVIRFAAGVHLTDRAESSTR